MLQLEIFKAGKGDCFLLTWNQNHAILIDTGVEGTYRHIQRKLDEVNLEAIIVTHVDYDHVGGLFKMLEDSTFRLGKNTLIFMNTSSLFLYPDHSDMVKIQHGIELNSLLAKRELTPLNLYIGSNTNNVINIKGLSLQVLSPSENILNELIKRWTATEIYQQYIERSKESDGYVSTRSSKLTAREYILKYPPKPKAWEKDILNASSIAFIATFCEKKILFLGDANPDLVSVELDNLGFTKSNPLNVDLVKISHHGSKHNTTKNILERLSCTNYLISTDSSGPYYHPNRETIILISEYGRMEKSTTLNIYSNYDLNISSLLSSDEIDSININFEQIETLQLL